ncbi:9227_t:CDS:2, partial [Cetraspora pellucida]
MTHFIRDFLAIDCEFIETEVSAGSITVFSKHPAQVTLTDYYGNVVLNKYIRPDEDIGLWRASPTFKILLRNNGSRFEEVQSEVIETINDKALKLDLPKNKLRDVSLCKRFAHETSTTNGSKSLKTIVKEELNRDIQLHTKHDAAEDAIATMELFVKFRELWQEMVPKKDYTKRWLTTTAALISCPTTPPSSSELPSSSEPQCPTASIPPP